MAWPQPTDYNAAVQNPSLCFADPDLPGAVAAADPLARPPPRRGPAADVSQLRPPEGRAGAARSSPRGPRGRDRRYRALADHLGKARRPFLVDFAYLDEGIRVRGQWFPV